jgi:hypothetical protein
MANSSPAYYFGYLLISFRSSQQQKKTVPLARLSLRSQTGKKTRLYFFFFHLADNFCCSFLSFQKFGLTAIKGSLKSGFPYLAQ